MEKILEIKKLKKQFKDNIILNDINLEVTKQDIYGILGLSGAGKYLPVSIELILMTSIPILSASFSCVKPFNFLYFFTFFPSNFFKFIIPSNSIVQ